MLSNKFYFSIWLMLQVGLSAGHQKSASGSDFRKSPKKHEMVGGKKQRHKSKEASFSTNAPTLDPINIGIPTSLVTVDPSSIPSTVPTLHPSILPTQTCLEQRYAVLDRYLQLTGFLVDLTIPDWEKELSSMLYINFTQTVAETGSWSPRDYALEYQLAGLPEYNGGVFGFVNRIIIRDTFKELNQSTTVFTSNDTAFLLGSTLPSLSKHKFTFLEDDNACSLTLSYHYIELPTLLVDGARFSVEHKSNEDIDELCENIFNACQEEPLSIRPYESVEDCAWFFQSLPSGCDKQGLYLGNTTQCRSLHLINSRINPTTHCPHTSPGSEGKCAQEDCSSYLWPAYVNATDSTLLEIEDVEKLFDRNELETLLRQGILSRHPHSKYQEGGGEIIDGCDDKFETISDDENLQDLLQLGTTCSQMAIALSGLGSSNCEATPLLQGFGYDETVQQIIQRACPNSCGVCDVW